MFTIDDNADSNGDDGGNSDGGCWTLDHDEPRWRTRAGGSNFTAGSAHWNSNGVTFAEFPPRELVSRHFVCLDMAPKRLRLRSRHFHERWRARAN